MGFASELVQQGGDGREATAERRRQRGDGSVLAAHGYYW